MVQVIAAAAVIIIVAGEGVSGVGVKTEAIAVRGSGAMVSEAEIAVMAMMPSAICVGMVPTVPGMGVG
jgi:hypothetical protein